MKVVLMSELCSVIDACKELVMYISEERCLTNICMALTIANICAMTKTHPGR